MIRRAEIRIHDVEIADGDHLARLAQAQRVLHRDARFSATVVSGQNGHALGIQRCLLLLALRFGDFARALLPYYNSYSSLRMIFPLVVFGRFSRNTTMRGYLYGAVWLLTYS
ncbi:hypothetical protein SDC9_207181 [bioreactor metagenome]|uniref:Uncharacterized protein n=1 Tax=bioreactor metagenome TaxID=1076179 RepID=A0A645J8I5_9ZZZZ